MDMALLWDMCQGSCWEEASGISHHVGKKLGPARGTCWARCEKEAVPLAFPTHCPWAGLGCFTEVGRGPLV